MSQDIVADALNQIMNAKKARKVNVVLKRHSKLLCKILDLAKESGFLEYTINGNELTVDIIGINEFKAIKPRYTVSVKRINHYVRRFLPAKDFGFVIVSTNQGLMKHSEAEEKNIGGCMIAYVY